MKKFIKLLATICCLILGVTFTLTGCGCGAEPQSTTFTLTLDYAQALFADIDRWNIGPADDKKEIENTFDETTLATTFKFKQNASYNEQVFIKLPFESGWTYKWSFSYQSSTSLAGENNISAQIFDTELKDGTAPIKEEKVTPTTTKQSRTLSYTCTESKDYYVVIQLKISEQSEDLDITVSNPKLLAQKTYSKSDTSYGELPIPEYVNLRQNDRDYDGYFEDSQSDLEFASWQLGEETISSNSQLKNKSDHTLVATWGVRPKDQTSEDSVSGCIAFGTKVRLANGDYKNIEDISFYDRIYRFNHDTGKIDTGYCHWLNKHSTTDGEQEVVYVKFADGGKLTFIPPHAMFTKNFNTETNECVYQYSAVTDSDNFHVGTQIAKMDYSSGLPVLEWTEVTEIKISHDIVEYCQPIMGQMWNFFASDYLTNEADALEFHNMYGFNENLVYANPLRQKVLNGDYLKNDNGEYIYGYGMNQDGTENTKDLTYTLECTNIFGMDLTELSAQMKEYNINLPTSIQVHLYSEETMKNYFNMLPRDMTGYRGAEWQILVEWCSFLYEYGLTTTEGFTNEIVRDVIIRDTVNSAEHKQETIKNSENKSLWVVTTDNDSSQSFTVPKTVDEIAEFEKQSCVYTDYSKYTVPEYKGANEENFAYWYCSADSKTYKAGATFEVRYSSHFTAVFK